jgi:hypothetical protein
MGDGRCWHRRDHPGRARRVHSAQRWRPARWQPAAPQWHGDSIRHNSDGGVAISDGAFAETKEVIGGYYLIDAADLDEALRIAVQVPAPFGGVEVRPTWTASGPEAT